MVAAIDLNSVSTQDANELTVNYDINTNLQSAGVQSFTIAIYRSDQRQFDPNLDNNVNEVEVASYQLTGANLNQGTNQTITIVSTVCSATNDWGMNVDILTAPLVPDPAASLCLGRPRRRERPIAH